MFVYCCSCSCSDLEDFPEILIAVFAKLMIFLAISGNKKSEEVMMKLIGNLKFKASKM